MSSYAGIITTGRDVGRYIEVGGMPDGPRSSEGVAKITAVGGTQPYTYEAIEGRLRFRNGEFRFVPFSPAFIFKNLLNLEEVPTNVAAQAPALPVGTIVQYQRLRRFRRRKWGFVMANYRGTW
jgi:hypothetical protein